MNYTIGPGVYHPGVITMDTAGNHINTWEYPLDPYGLGSGKGVKSSDGGAWIAFRDGGASSAYTSIKMDAAGNILKSKSWSTTMLQAYNMNFYPNNRIIYGNGSLYIPCMIDSQFSFVVLDTSLNSPCYGPDKIINLTSTIFVDSGHPAQTPDYLSSTFTDSVMTISNITMSNASPICQPTSITEIHFPELRVYPNPAFDEITVEGLADASAFKLYDIPGRMHNTEWFIQDGHVKIDLSGIAPGVYLLTDGRAWVRVLKVERQ